MNKNKKLSILDLIYISLLILVLQLGISLLAIFFNKIFNIDKIIISHFFKYINNVFIISLIPIIWVKIIKKESLNLIGIKYCEKKWYILSLSIALFFCVLLSFQLFFTYKYILYYKPFIQYDIYLFILQIFIVPVSEEIFFRGIVFNAFKTKYGFINGVILSSLIFALMHNVYNFGYVGILFFLLKFIMGSFFCVLFYKSKSIFPSILAHSVINYFNLIFYSVLILKID